jgi:hypothetical protein
MQSLVNMPGKGTHVLQDKLRLTKDLCVDALQDKVLFLFGIQCYEEGVIDVSVPEFPNVYDPARWFELLCNSNKIIQSFSYSFVIFVE